MSTVALTANRLLVLLTLFVVELPVTVYEQNNQKGIAAVFTIVLLVIPFLISGLQLNHAVVAVAVGEFCWMISCS